VTELRDSAASLVPARNGHEARSESFNGNRLLSEPGQRPRSWRPRRKRFSSGLAGKCESSYIPDVRILSRNDEGWKHRYV